MTFSIAGHCERSGMFGIAISTSSICVGSRCPWARPGVGAVVTQNFTDPNLGPRGLDLLTEGLSASQVIRLLVKENPYSAYRQLAVIDREGRTATHSGEKTLAIHGAAEGDHCVAIGNLLANSKVPQEIVATFTQYPGDALAHRLLLALESGLRAGGEINPVRSAGLLIVHQQAWPIVDLRVDWHENPIGMLRELWQRYESQIGTFLIWALTPDKAPPIELPKNQCCPNYIKSE